MNRNESRELREQRAAIAHQMSELTTGGLKTAEDRTKFDALDAEQDQLRQRIDRIEKATNVSEELRQSGKPPAGQPGGVDDPEVKQAAEKRARAFRNYLKFGLGGEHRVGRMPDEDRQIVLEMRDMTTGGSGAGVATSGAGIFVPVGFVASIVEALKYYGPMLDGGAGMPDIMETATGQILPFPTDNDTTNVGELLGESTQVGTADVSIGSVTLGAFKFSSKMVKVSIELLQDSAFNIEAYLVKKFATRLGRILNTKLTTGAGTTEPYGIVTQATSGGTAVGTSANDGTAAGGNTIGSDDMVTLEHSVDPLYRRQAKFMFHDSTLAALKKVKDKYGRPLWLPGVAVNAPDTINGYGYAINNDMDQLQSQTSSPPVTKKTVLFGDLTKYQIRRVKDMSVLRLEERFADFGQVAFIAFCRYDAALLDAGTHPVKYLANTY